MSNNIFKRVSIRKYKDTLIKSEAITSMLHAAMAAPSAGNQQPWEYYVVTDKEVLLQLSKASPYARCAKNAPLAFVACYCTTDLAFPEYVHLDMSASVENLLLEAVNCELGAVWLGIAPSERRMKRVAEALKLPESLKAFAIIPCGYPAEEKEQEERYDETKVHYI